MGKPEKDGKYACQSLPQGFEIYKRIDLTRDRDALKAMVIWSITAALALILPMLFVHPVKYAFDMPAVKIVICVAASALGLIVYMFLHEWTHSVCIRAFTGTSASVGLELKRGIAYASSRWYFKKTPYMIIALAPVIIWGMLLALLMSDIDEKYFWYLYVIQIFNVTGASGDIYVVCAALRMPKKILVLDSGMAMEFYAETVLCCR